MYVCSIYIFVDKAREYTKKFANSKNMYILYIQESRKRPSLDSDGVQSVGYTSI
jgi:hypothetical protein